MQGQSSWCPRSYACRRTVSTNIVKFVRDTITFPGQGVTCSLPPVTKANFTAGCTETLEISIVRVKADTADTAVGIRERVQMTQSKRWAKSRDLD